MSTESVGPAPKAEHGSLRITKHHHACVFVEDGGTRLLIDPGELGPRPSLDGVDAVLITHRHFDHFDPVFVHQALEHSIPVWAPADVLDDVGGHEKLHEAAPGASFAIGTLTVMVAGEHHAEVHPEVPGPANRAYLIGETVFITGDEHPAPPGPFTALVTPIDAPWLRAVDLIRYVRKVKPRQIIGIHDGLLNGHGRSVARHSAQHLLNEGAAESSVPNDGDTVHAVRASQKQ